MFLFLFSIFKPKYFYSKLDGLDGFSIVSNDGLEITSIDDRPQNWKSKISPRKSVDDHRN